MSDDLVERLRDSVSLHGEAADEIESLRQGIWDAYGILGFDQDGDKTPHVVFARGRSWADFLRDFATEERADHDAAIAGLR